MRLLCRKSTLYIQARNCCGRRWMTGMGGWRVIWTEGQAPNKLASVVRVVRNICGRNCNVCSSCFIIGIDKVISARIFLVFQDPGAAPANKRDTGLYLHLSSPPRSLFLVPYIKSTSLPPNCPSLPPTDFTPLTIPQRHDLTSATMFLSSLINRVRVSFPITSRFDVFSTHYNFSCIYIPPKFQTILHRNSLPTSYSISSTNSQRQGTVALLPTSPCSRPPSANTLSPECSAPSRSDLEKHSSLFKIRSVLPRPGVPDSLPKSKRSPSFSTTTTHSTSLRTISCLSSVHAPPYAPCRSAYKDARILSALFQSRWNSKRKDVLLLPSAGLLSPSCGD